MMRRIAIIGGGPGGLMTAYRLQQYCSVPFQVTIYEASERLGGKVLTGQFGAAPVGYEAGAAELYDYSHVGPDPLRELVQTLELSVIPMSGAAIVLQGKILNDLDDVGRVHGATTRHALLEFDKRAKRWMSPQEYYEADGAEANSDPMSQRTFEEELARVSDPAAQRFLRTMVHSDLATEPHRTSAAYGLQNYLMNDDRYLRLYTIEGGIEQLTLALQDHLEAKILLREPVLQVERVADEKLRVTSRRLSTADEARTVAEDYDFVVVALPNSYLPSITWKGDRLSQAMHRHHVHYDYPAHYLRISVLFREVFWRHLLQDSYFTLDAFGGCCLYDESSRNGSEAYGALGWLLAGDAAMNAANHTDEELTSMVLDSLPSFLQHGREMFVEARVHRWIGAVNGMPGGHPMLSLEARHLPEPERPNLFIVGDYLFDSTLNGVLDSADHVAESLAGVLASQFHSETAAISA